MKNFYKAGAFLLAAAMIGCSSSDDGGGQDGNGSCESDITFLQEGKWFKYKTSQLGFDTGTMKMNFNECDGDGIASTMEFRNPQNVVTNTIPMKFWQEGVWMMSDPNANGAPFFKQYKKDAQLNDTWEEVAADGDIITHTVIDIDSVITVPAGTFHCKVYKYENSGNINDSYIFWHDEVGQVMEDADGWYKSELMEHN